MGTYKIMLIFLPEIKEESRKEIIENVCGEITKLKGEVLHTESLGSRVFARPLKKRESGFYIRLQVELYPDVIDVLLARFKLNIDIFRVQILRSSSHDTMASKKKDGKEDAIDQGYKNTVEVVVDG